MLSRNLRTHTYHGQFEAKDSEKGVTSSQPHLAIPRLSITTNSIQLPNMLSPQTHCGVRTRILPNHLLVFHLALDSTGFEGPSCPHPRQQSYLSCGRSTENTGPAQGRGFREHLTQRMLAAVPSGCLLAGHRGLCGSHNSQLLCTVMGEQCVHLIRSPQRPWVASEDPIWDQDVAQLLQYLPSMPLDPRFDTQGHVH